MKECAEFEEGGQMSITPEILAKIEKESRENYMGRVSSYLDSVCAALREAWAEIEEINSARLQQIEITRRKANLLLDVIADRDQAVAERDNLMAAMRDIVDELGVPQPGYSSPVTNAYEIARRALAEKTGGDQRQKEKHEK